MKTRILVAIPITLLVLGAVFIQSWFLAVFAVILSLSAQYEAVRALRSSSFPPIPWVSVVFAAAAACLFLMDFGSSPASSMAWLDGSTVLALFIALAIAAFISAMRSRKYTFESVEATVFTMVYPQLFMMCFYLLILQAARTADGLRYVQTILSLLMLFIPPVFSDTLAYFWGRKFGRTKLAPVISPKKTVAGSVAGIVGGAAGAVVLWSVINAIGWPRIQLAFGWAAYVAMGAALAALSQVGDLAASYLKRSVDIKDFGRLLPGHGGVMDRIDSTMFVMPLAALFSSFGWLSTVSV